MKETANYSIEPTKEEGVYQLMMEGIPVLCPYRQPLITQTNMGQTKLINIPCTNQCALFEYIIDVFDEKNNFKVTHEIKLHCSDRIIKIKIQKDGNQGK